MRRKLFFLIEKLEIRRSERIAISTLLVLLVFTSGYFLIKEPKANYNPGYYEQLEQLFEERSKSVEEERNRILARYNPETDNKQAIPVLPAATHDTSKPDTTGTDEPDEISISDLVNINTAGAEELQELPGIGPAYAQRIIEWRVENGDFTSKDQLLEIRGIGETRLSRIKPLITL